MATRDEAYTFMESYKYANLDVLTTEYEASRIESSIHRITQIFSGEAYVVGGSDEKSRENMIFGFLMIKEQIKEEEIIASECRDRVAEMVAIIKRASPQKASVLKARYLTFFSVKQTAILLSYSEKRIKQITQEAMDDVALILSIKEDGKSKENAS